MRVIIAGNRVITDYELVKRVVAESGFLITRVLSGRARGADQLGERWAREHGVPVLYFPADWQTFGKGAGFIRNREMAKHADALIAIRAPPGPGNPDKGTPDMIKVARAQGLLVHEHVSVA